MDLRLPGDEDTIAAISTAIGEGAIGIVRLSGPQAVPIVDSIFRARSGKPVADQATYTTKYGQVLAGAEVVDEVIVTLMRAPRSYTREDVVEINCHGGPAALKRVLDLVVAAGARPAGPGEFTRRAFLNGRIDLAQAEAVLEVIRAKTEASLRSALGQLEGGLSGRVEAICGTLGEVLACLEAGIDFPEEDLSLPDRQQMEALLAQAQHEMAALIAASDRGRVLRDGVLCVLAGKPNVGKSSLMNALLREHRVIVTPVPGTTRDAVEEYCNLGGLPVRLVDTAGVREPGDVVEEQGVARSRAYLRRADLAVLVLDRSRPLDDEDRAVMAALEGVVAVAAANKSDLPPAWDEIAGFAGPMVAISAKTGAGLEQLERQVAGMVWKGEVMPAESPLTVSARHSRSLERATEALARARRGIAAGEPEEFVALEVQGALDHLGEITGRTAGPDLVERIFSRFCIGK